MSGSSDCFESAHPQLKEISGASEQESDIPLFQQQHFEPSTPSNVEAEDSIGNSANTAVGWPSSPITENQTGAVDWSIGSGMDNGWDLGPSEVASTHTEAADWSNMPNTDDGPWEYVTPREVVPTEFGE